MRKPRLLLPSGGCYHVCSRIVDRVMRLNYSEKVIFLRMMRKAEGFSGVNILTYSLMDNHIHILLEIPKSQGFLDEKEIVRRMQILYGHKYVRGRRDVWAEWRDLGMAWRVEDELERMRKRMGNLSEFMKTLKQRYSISYNSRFDRCGTLWEGRFNSTIVEMGKLALSYAGAYIDLNPIRGGLVEDPKDYRWSGYGEACGGNSLAQEGLMTLITKCFNIAPEAFQEGLEEYRQLLYIVGKERYSMFGDHLIKKGFTQAQVDEVLKARGKLSPAEALSCRVRYFTAGVAIGSKEFCEKIFNENRHYFSEKRKTGARKMRHADWGGLCTLRELRKEPIGPPLSG